MLKEKYLDNGFENGSKSRKDLNPMSGRSQSKRKLANVKKYQNYVKYQNGKYIDQELLSKAKEIVNENAQNRKYFNKRLVTQNTGVILSRWASDIERLKEIARQQKRSIDSDAIFGRVDPRDTGMVKLKEIFEPTIPSQFRKYNQVHDLAREHRINNARGSSARQWNDNSEFATPHVAQEAH